MSKGEPRIGFLAAGPLGAGLLRSIPVDTIVSAVASYPVRGYESAFAEIERLCEQRRWKLIQGHGAEAEVCADGADLVFVAGWQFLIARFDERFVVFHDSLLPKYRGFAPTVSALIAGETHIGCTAFQMSTEMDRGPIFSQRAVEVSYPCRLDDAFALLSSAYRACAEDAIDAWRRGISPKAQSESGASYCIWRDRADMFIDWSSTASEIRRFVDALSGVYGGATTWYRQRTISIVRVEEICDVPFVKRFPGKFWQLIDGIPSVVCGEGMIRVLDAREEDGNVVPFTHLRERFN